jgi:hypothetical protein
MEKEASNHKQQWVRGHAKRLLQHWLRRRTPFGIAPEYIRQLERDLSRSYEQPLLRAFFENTY